MYCFVVVALIKMGDYHWYGCEGNRDADSAVDFYTRAAMKRDPHVCNTKHTSIVLIFDTVNL